MFNTQSKLDPEIESYFVDNTSSIRLNSRYFSSANLNAFIEHNSSPRGLMMSSHVAQIIVINDPEVNMVQTGSEKEFAKYAIQKKIEDPVEIIEIIKRYDTIKIKKDIETLVIFKNLNTGEIDAINIPKINRYHPYFGFEFQTTEAFRNMKKSDILTQETILAKPPTVMDNGYGFGVDANVALMTLPGVDEDGFIISESFGKKMKYKIFETYNINFGTNSYLLNLYGDDEHYKPFPNIGEYVNQDGVICAVRDISTLEYGEFLLPALMNKYDSMEFNPIFDKAVYGRKKGKVIDIKVWRNNRLKKDCPSGTTALLNDYKDALVTYYKRILHTYNVLKREYANFNLELNLSPKLRTLIVTAIGMVESDKEFTKLKKTYKKEEIDYRVEITVEYELTIGVKNKLSNFHGNKGTVVEIWPDENMPVDKDGNKADIIADPRSIVNRLNVGLLYERYTKAAAIKAKKLLTEELKKITNTKKLTNGDIVNLPENIIEDVFKDYVLEFVKLIDSPQYEAYKNVYDNGNIDAIIEIILEIVNDKFYIYLTPDNKTRKWKIVWSIKHSKFNPVYDKVKFVYDGKFKVSKKNILIAPIYTILLNKIGDNGLACASAKTNHFGLPIVISKKNKNRLPYRNNPVRIIGETESRIIVAYGGRYMLAELRDRAANLDTHGELYKNIILADKPTNVETYINRKKFPYGKDRPLILLNSIWNTTGFELKYEPDKRKYINYDPKKIKDINITYEELLDKENTIESEGNDG